MSRGGLKINRVDPNFTDRSDRVDWLDSFADAVEKISKDPTTAVEAARSRDIANYTDQISAIISRKQDYNSVEGVVQYYQNQTGLTDYLKRVQSEKIEEANRKIAQEIMEAADGMENDLPESFGKLSDKDREDIKNFIRNKCETHHGNIQVPALVEEVSQTFRQKGIEPQDVNDTKFEKFISDEIIRAKKQNPNADEHNVNIGLGVGINSENTMTHDAFESLNPAK